jgi:DNA polymerase-3 subunit delta
LKPKRGGASVEADVDDSADAAADAADVRPLEEYLSDPVGSTTLLFVATEIDRGRRLTKRLLEAALVTEFSGLAGPGGAGPDDRAASEWIRSEMTRAGRTIEPGAARLLATRSGGDITKLRGDVERLLLYVGDVARIETEDVLAVVAEGSREDDWAVVNALAAGDPARALAAVAGLLDQGTSPHQLLGQLRWWVAVRLAEADPSRVKPAMDALLRTDLALKSSGGDDRVLLERLTLELTGRPLQARGWTGRR